MVPAPHVLGIGLGDEPAPERGIHLSYRRLTEGRNRGNGLFHLVNQKRKGANMRTEDRMRHAFMQQGGAP